MAGSVYQRAGRLSPRSSAAIRLAAFSSDGLITSCSSILPSRLNLGSRRCAGYIAVLRHLRTRELVVCAEAIVATPARHPRLSLRAEHSIGGEPANSIEDGAVARTPLFSMLKGVARA